MTLCPPRPLNFHRTAELVAAECTYSSREGHQLRQHHQHRMASSSSASSSTAVQRRRPPVIMRLTNHSRSPTGRTLRLRRVRAHCCRETRASPVLRLPGSDRTPRVEKDTPGATGSCALGSRCVCGVERKIRPSFSFPSSTLIFYLDLTTNSQLFYLIAHLR